MEKPLPGSRGPKLPTMMLPIEQNPSEYEEHFVFHDPAHPYRRAVVKQELADVRPLHRLDVKRKACESQGEQFHKTSARSSVEKLSTKSIFGVADDRAKTHAEHVREDPAELSTRKSL